MQNPDRAVRHAGFIESTQASKILAERLKSAQNSVTGEFRKECSEM